jgi:hypothetical protein
MSRRPIGWVLPCVDAVLGPWFDFKDGPNHPGSGWIPVVPQTDPLLEGMQSVLWCGHTQTWDARAKGCALWAKAPTAYEAVALAAQLARDPEEEIELW